MVQYFPIYSWKSSSKGLRSGLWIRLSILPHIAKSFIFLEHFLPSYFVDLGTLVHRILQAKPLYKFRLWQLSCYWALVQAALLQREVDKVHACVSFHSKRKFCIGLNFNLRLMSLFSLVVSLGRRSPNVMTIDHALIFRLYIISWRFLYIFNFLTFLVTFNFLTFLVYFSFLESFLCIFNFLTFLVYFYFLVLVLVSCIFSISWRSLYISNFLMFLVNFQFLDVSCIFAILLMSLVYF